MSEHLVVNDTRTGVFIVRNFERVICIWGAVFKIDLMNKEDDGFGGEKCVEYQNRCKVKIHRAPGGVPILLPRRRCVCLLPKTIRRFEEENQVRCVPVELRDLNSRADSEFGKTWLQLNLKERLNILEWLATE
jgi:hypothetical protein